VAWNEANFRVVNHGTLWHCHTSQLNREFEMSFRKASLAAMLAVSMTGTPLLAQTAPSAAPLSVAERSGAETQEASELRGGFIIPLLAVVAVIAGLLAAFNDDDEPNSP
jgi:hypothetical protein